MSHDKIPYQSIRTSQQSKEGEMTEKTRFQYVIDYLKEENSRGITPLDKDGYYILVDLAIDAYKGGAR